MRNAALFVLLAAVGVLGILAYFQLQSIEQLTTQVQTASKATALELQEKCARQAKAYFDANTWGPYQHAGFANHYDAASNKCFVLVNVIDNSKAGHVSQNLLLSDAFEGTDLGDFMLWADKTADSGRPRRSYVTSTCHLAI